MGRLLYSALIGLSVPAVFPGPYPVPFLRIVRCLRRAAPSPLPSSSRLPILAPPSSSLPYAPAPARLLLQPSLPYALLCPPCSFHRPHTGVPPLIFPRRCPCKYRCPHLYRVPLGPRSRVPCPRPVHVRPGVSKQALPPVPPSRLIIARLRRYVPLWPFPAPCGRCPHSRSPAVRAVPRFLLHVLLHAFTSRALSAA